MPTPTLTGVTTTARRHAKRRLRQGREAVGLPAPATRRLTADADPRLHLGCGGALLDGWLNTDRDPPGGAVFVDITRRFALPDGAFAHALAEHVIEHVPLEHGRAMLRECRRVLRPGGRVRISTPDLERLVALTGPQQGPAARRYLEWAAGAFCPGARGSASALVLNNAFRAWDHQFLYDEETLTRALADAGFEDITRHEYRMSDDPVFAGVEGHGIDAIGLEMRAFETLALEGRVPA